MSRITLAVGITYGATINVAYHDNASRIDIQSEYTSGNIIIELKIMVRVLIRNWSRKKVWKTNGLGIIEDG